MTNMDRMDSIWLEDGHRDKLYTAHPNMEVLNSDTPYLQSNTLELPPLPPTSYFTTLMAQRAEEEEKIKKKKSKLLNAFMNSFKSDKSKQRLRTKISTPFGFSHISHIDKDTTITNKTFEIHVPTVDAKSMAGPTTQAVAYNRTEPTVLPRSSSLANSLSSNTFSRASVSTTATSTRVISRKNTQSHHHTVSSSSIEQLSKLEKYQISKQCSYSPTSPSLKHKDSMNWDAPSPNNAVRQSWIYHDESPKTLYTNENIMLRESMLMTTPLKEHIDRFTTTLNFDETPEFAEIQRGMKELMLGEDDQETIIRAAQFTRMSRDLMKDLDEGDMLAFKQRLEEVLRDDASVSELISM